MSQQPKSIAIFSAYYPPHLGGVELFTKNLAKALIQKGVLVTVVTSSSPHDGAPSSSYAQNDNPDIIALPSISMMNDRFPLIVPSKDFFSLRRQIKERAFDGIVVNTRYYPISLLGCREANRRRIRPILIDHSSGPISTDRSPFGVAMRLYERMMTSAIKASNPQFCSVSKRGLEWLQSLELPTSRVIPNSIDAEAYRQLSSNKNWREELNLDRATFLVTYAGRLIPEKGLPKLIKAIRGLHEDGNDIVLAVAGDGPLANDLKNDISSYIRYVGKLAQNDLSALLACTDCFCLPTEYPEGLPTVLLEAAAQKCAIVVSDCAGAREVIADSSMGIILPTVSARSIADAIIHLMSNSSKRQEMAANVKRNVENAFSWEKTASELMETISNDTRRAY